MTTITYITPTFAVAPALRDSDFAKLRDAGFKAVISNLPDDEDEAQLSGHEAAARAWRNGLAFRHIPSGKLDLFTDRVVDDSQTALGNLDGPVIAYCQSGMRSAIIWAAAASRSQPVDSVLAALERAGFDLEFLRDEFEAQAGGAQQPCSTATPEHNQEVNAPATGAAA